MTNPVSETVPSTDHHIVLVGMRRCGNHAIVNWLTGMAGSHAFYNNVEPTDPYERTADDRVDDSRRPGFVELVVTSFEDRSLRLLKGHQPPIAAKTTYVLLLRDPLNLFASQLHSGRLEPASRSGLSMPQLYLTYAREFEGVTRHLPRPVVCLSYNEWCSSEQYRRRIATRLELDFDRENVDGVSKIGGGSSFDGLGYAERGSQMATHRRWERLADDPRLLRWLANPELLRFAGRTFRMEDEARSFIDQVLENIPVHRPISDEASIRFVERASVRLRNVSAIHRAYRRLLPLLGR